MNEAKPVLYLLPGLLCNEQCWTEQATALSAVAEVRIPSFKGKDSLVGMAESVLEGAPERFSIVGHSMGGRVAWEVLRLVEQGSGKEIDKFAVMDTGIHPVAEGEVEKRQQFLELAARDMQALADHWIPPMVHPDRVGDKALTSAIESMMFSYTFDEFRGQIAALLGREDQSLYLPGYEHDVLLICGDKDQWSPVSRHEEMLALLKKGRLEVIRDSGHMVTMEQPEAVNRLLLDWLAA